MLFAKIKRLICILLVLLCGTSLFAAGTDLATRYLDKANEAYENADIDAAYRYINQAMALNKNEEASANILYYAQTIYKQKLTGLLNEYDALFFIDIQSKLEQYPAVANSTIKKLVKQIETVQEEKKLEDAKAIQQRQAKAEEDLRTAQKETAEAMRQQTKALQEQTVTNQKNQEELKSALTTGFESIKDSNTLAANETKAAINKVVIIIIGIVVLILLIVLMILFIARRSFKNQQIQQENYINAFKMLAASQNQTNRLMLGGVTDLYGQNGGNLRIAGSSRWTPVAALPDNIENDPEEKEELAKLASKCEEIGHQIDQVTGRKNNSKNVSELVYKLALQLGLPQGEAMLYFCASMIYDAGFLGIDEALFTAETLTDDQKKALREHVNLAEKYLDFVPKKYWQIFQDAAENHHENMDGSGYPKGRKGDDIPQIARILRVAESFISMSSKRDYRQILDKESAIEKLREQPQFYDQDVVDVLEELI